MVTSVQEISDELIPDADMAALVSASVRVQPLVQAPLARAPCINLLSTGQRI